MTESSHNTSPSIQIQSVLFNNDMASIVRSLECIERAVELALHEGICSFVRVSYGDSSPIACISATELHALRERFSATFELRYTFFDGNLGSARGHNTLGLNSDTDYILVQNPDVVVSPRLFENLLSPFSNPKVGMVEAKQLPIEHPKDYDPVTGETGWATTACALIPIRLFRELDGFDADSFFLYCDDVDFSWQIRRAGYKVIFQPAAVVFHDKRLTASAGWQASTAERYYSAEAACFITYKWSRSDLTEKYLKYFRSSGNELERKAAQSFIERREAGRLPKPLDPEHKIAEFVDYMYTKHRYAL